MTNWWECYHTLLGGSLGLLCWQARGRLKPRRNKDDLHPCLRFALIRLDWAKGPTLREFCVLHVVTSGTASKRFVYFTLYWLEVIDNLSSLQPNHCDVWFVHASPFTCFTMQSTGLELDTSLTMLCTRHWFWKVTEDINRFNWKLDTSR